jgi:hypothetical protein
LEKDQPKPMDGDFWTEDDGERKIQNLLSSFFVF